jgi:hypothetical protein
MSMLCHLVISVLNIITNGLLPRVCSALVTVHVCLALRLCTVKASGLRCLNFRLHSVVLNLLIAA